MLPDVAIGGLPATPIMHWLLQARRADRSLPSGGLFAHAGRAAQEGHLAAALQSVLDHHDALRLRVVTGASATGHFF